MIKLESIQTKPTFSSQLEDKILYSSHLTDIVVSYESTYTLKYVMEGVKHYHYHNEDIELSKNQYLILNKDSKIKTEAKKGTKGLSFFLSPKLIDEICAYYTNGRSSIEFLEVTQKASKGPVQDLLANAAYLFEHRPIVFQTQLDDLFIKISELIVRQQINIDTNFAKLKIVKHNTRKELYQLVMQAKEYLQDNLKEEISLDLIGKEVGISKYYLHRLFTEIQGQTPTAYLTAIRLEKAKNQLRLSKDSIFDIAMACGFDTSAYFSNTFKRHLGCSPSEFRKGC